MSQVRYIVNIKIRDLENFKAVGQKCIEANKTVQGCDAYEWTINGDQCVLHEAWADEQAAFDHLSAVGALIPDLLKYSEFTSIEVLTPVSAELQTAFDGLPAVFFEPLYPTITA